MSRGIKESGGNRKPTRQDLKLSFPHQLIQQESTAEESANHGAKEARPVQRLEDMEAEDCPQANHGAKEARPVQRLEDMETKDCPQAGRD